MLERNYIWSRKSEVQILHPALCGLAQSGRAPCRVKPGSFTDFVRLAMCLDVECWTDLHLFVAGSSPAPRDDPAQAGGPWVAQLVESQALKGVTIRAISSTSLCFGL